MKSQKKSTKEKISSAISLWNSDKKRKREEEKAQKAALAKRKK